MDVPQAPSLLIVDDTPTNISLLVEALKDDYQVRVAIDGEDALAAVSEERPDLILLDVNMPGMSGAEVCRILKAEPDTAGIPIIFVTGRDDEADELLGLQLGAADYVTRPFSIPILRARIQTHLKIKSYQDQLERLSLLDGLTGIPNRRRFDEFLRHQILLSSRGRTQVGLILLDIDHFKLYNDTFGHQAGDVCLRAVGQALVGGLRRSTDLVARYGGEEFVCVLPDATMEGTLMVAEALRCVVKSLALPHAPASGRATVTVSLGATARVPGFGEAMNILVEEADQALYQAKGQGRDRVVAFTRTICG